MTNMHGVRGHNSRNAPKPKGKAVKSPPPTKGKGGAKGRSAS